MGGWLRTNDRDIDNLYMSDNENLPKLNCHSFKIGTFCNSYKYNCSVQIYFLAEILEFMNALHLESHSFPYHMYTQSRGYNSTKSQFLHILV